MFIANNCIPCASMNMSELELLTGVRFYNLGDSLEEYSMGFRALGCGEGTADNNR